METEIMRFVRKDISPFTGEAVYIYKEGTKYIHLSEQQHQQVLKKKIAIENLFHMEKVQGARL
jgi:hypothetical protein